MATKKNDDVPPVPVPPPGASAVPPVEPPPAAPGAPETPASPEAPVPPAEPEAPRANPYAAPAAPVAPVAGYAAPPAQPAAYPAGAYTPQPAGPPQGLSIASMILGIGGLLLSFVGFGFLPALAAVITGHLAQRRQPYARPFWLTGIITGYVGVGINLIFGFFALLFFIAAIGSASYFG
jgi:hypothetical protein